MELGGIFVKWIYNTVVIILVIVLIGAIGFTLHFYRQINHVYNENITYTFDDQPNSHFSLILNIGDEIYWQNFIEGVYEAAKVNNIAIELNKTSGFDSIGKMVEFINIAKISQVDGIIINGETENDYRLALNDLISNDMEVVLTGTESVKGSHLIYVGTNFYEFGVQAAKLIKQTSDQNKPINLAVIVSSEHDNIIDTPIITQSNMMLSGIQSISNQDPQINLLTVLQRSNDLLGAEDLTREILNKYDGVVDVIFCTNVKDTNAAARVIIERNLVGEVVIVGTDVTDEIINYINKGVVFGVIDRNGYAAGYESVSVLQNSLDGVFQENYVDIDIDIYTVINIINYEKSK